jgi:hypothetical protein
LSWSLQPPGTWPQNSGGSPLAWRTLQNYFDKHFPAAVARAAHFRAINQPYSWMTQEWIVNLYLDCENSGIMEWSLPDPLNAPTATAKPLLRCPTVVATKAMRAAIVRGDIYFHAFPHNPSYGTMVRCAFSDRNPQSTMPLSFTPLLRLKRGHACDQCAFLSGVHCTYRLAL